MLPADGHGLMLSDAEEASWKCSQRGSTAERQGVCIDFCVFDSCVTGLQSSPEQFCTSQHGAPCCKPRALGHSIMYVPVLHCHHAPLPGRRPAGHNKASRGVSRVPAVAAPEKAADSRFTSVEQVSELTKCWIPSLLRLQHKLALQIHTHLCHEHKPAFKYTCLPAAQVH